MQKVRRDCMIKYEDLFSKRCQKLEEGIRC